MTIAYVELSGESRSLAVAETVSAARALGGGAAPEAFEVAGLVPVELPSEREAVELAGRLALARRTLTLRADTGEVERTARREGSTSASASFRRLGRPSGGSDAEIVALGRAYTEGGGRIELERPERRFWIAADHQGRSYLFEEISSVDRAATRRRRMPLLPFQRPVSLPPKLARAAANLARIRRGDRVLDPFLGTGALLAEAGLLGAKLYGIDRDAEMVRGAIRNLEHLEVPVESLIVGDAGEAEFEPAAIGFDALLTDPPYGRSSATGGEDVNRLVERVLEHWSAHLVPGARVVVIVPAGAPSCLPTAELRAAVAVRAHRSLTREFRLYEPAGPRARATSPREVM